MFLSEFELQGFFTFSSTERAVIERRRGPAMKLGLVLHLGFVRMSGRPLDAFRVLPVVLLRHLGKELGIPVPDVASLRALYSRARNPVRSPGVHSPVDWPARAAYCPRLRWTG
ncbi:MAG: hypothetical protein RL685_2732 [Pseudomonadota bacterium]